MARQELLELLKQGTLQWNTWRKEHPEIEPDFRDGNFVGADLSRIDLIGTDFSRADLSRSNLKGADLIRSNVSYVDLSYADLREADLSFADFKYTDLREADLSGAYLIGTNLEGANLAGANLSNANLSDADFSNTNLSQATLSGAIVGWTKFTALNLRNVKGLETVVHKGPSSIGVDTLYRSQGQIPESFLRKAGIPEDFLTYLPSLTNRAIEYYTCFISYASQDVDFAQRLYADLQANGVRCWFAPEDIKIGDKIRSRIDASIRLYDKLLLVLSEHSVASEWVKFEVEAAMEKENKEKRTVLFPIRLDDHVMHSETAWAADIRRMRHIGTFTRWKDYDAYQLGLKRLLRDLQPERPPQRNM